MAQQRVAACLVIALSFQIAFAQQRARVLGTVTAADGKTLTVKSETGETVSVQTAPNVLVQKVSPGERDLKRAQTITLSDIEAGDRVLVRGSRSEEGFRADSVVVMTAREIAQRDDSVRKAWQERGVLGVVEQVNAATGEVRIAGREPGQSTTVTITDKTNVRRYAPDSVRFADAVPASLADIRKGDQLRAMGEKSSAGDRLTAEHVVFGTFRTVAAEVSAVHPDRNEGKLLRVYLKPDSQLKKMALPGALRSGAPEGARGRMARGGRVPDLSAMLERMPSIRVEELKPTDVVIVSSTVGARTDELTAITLVAGAGPIVDMLREREAAPGQDPLAGGSSLDRGLEGMLGMPTQ
jgi:hypothetical protein